MAKVEIILQGQNNASSAIDETSNALKGLGGVADSVGGALGGLGGIAQTALGVFTGGALLEGATAIVGKLGELAGSPLDAWKNLDDAADTLTMKLGATGPALDAMTASVQGIYNSSAGLGESMGDIASTMGTLGQITGATGDTLQTLTSQLGYMKQVQGEGAVGAEEFARALQAWNIPAEQGGPLLDQMAAATQKFGISSADMASGLQRAAGAFQGMGLDVNQTMGLLAGFSAGGLNTEKAIAAMSTAAGKFAKDGVDMRTGLDAAVAAIQHAGTATEATRIAVETFGAKAGPGLATAIQQGKFSLDGLAATLGDTTGALQKTAEATMDFPEKMELMKRKVETSLAPLGAAIASGLGQVLDALTPLLDSAVAGFTPLIENVSFYTQALMAAVVGNESFGAILGPVGGVIDDAISLFRGIGGEVGFYVNALLEATRYEESFGAILGPVGDVIQGFYDILTGAQEPMGDWSLWFEALADDFESWGLADSIVSLGEKLWDAKEFVTSTIAGIQSALSNAWNDLSSGLAAGTPGAGVAGMLSALGFSEDTAGQIGAQVGSIVSAIERAKDRLGQAISLLLYAGDWSSSTGETIAGVLETALGLDQGTLGGLETAVNSAISTVQGAVGRIQSAIQSAIQGFNLGSALGGGSVGAGLGAQTFLLALGIDPSVANTVGDVVQGIFDNIKGRFQAGLQSWKDLASGNVGGAVADWAKMFGIPDGLAETVGGKVTQIVNDIKTRIQAAIQGFKDGISAGVGVAAINVLTALGIPEDTAVQIGQRVAGVVTGLNDARIRLQAALDAFKTGFTSGGVSGGASAFLSALGIDPSIVTTVQTVAGQIASAVTGAITTIKAAITGFQTGGASGLLSALGIDPAPIQQVIGIVLQLFSRLKDGISGFFAEIAPAAEPLRRLMSELAPMVTPALEALKTLAQFVGVTLAAAFAGLVGFVGGAMPGLGQVVRGTVEIIVGIFETLIGAVRTVGTVVSALVKGDWQGAWDGAKAGVQDMYNGINSIMSGLKDMFIGTVRAALNGLVSMLTGGKEDAGSATQKIIDGIKQILNGAIEEIKSIVVSIVNGIASAIAGGRTDIVSQMAQNAQAAWDAFTNIDWGKLGSDIVDGITRGVRDAASRLWDAARSVVSNALNAGQDAADAHSPSRAAAEMIGLPISQGIAVGIATGSSQVTDAALSVVMTGLNAVLSAMASGNAAQAMNEIASLFRAIVLGFAGESEGIGGNAYTHIKRLIDAVTAISGAMGDFITAVDQLIDFGNSAAARVALVETGQAYLVWMFNTIAHLAQQMALGAREAANHFINSEVGATLKGLADAIGGIKAVTDNVVQAVTVLLDVTAGGGQTTVFERLLSDQGGQNWILALVRAIVTWAAQIASVATEATGEVPMATANLSNLNNTLTPLSGALAGTVGAVMEVWTATSGGGQVSTFEQLLNSAPGRDWILNVISATVIWAVQIAAVATTAAGEVPVATASLQNLNNTLQPFASVVTSTTSAIKALDDAISNSTVMGVVAGPMSELIWRPYYEMIAGQIVTFAVQLAAAATAAVGTVPAASASLTNLNNALQPFGGVITSTLGIIKSIGDIAGDDKLLALLGGQGASLAQAFYTLIAIYIVQFAVGVNSAVEGAIPVVKAASDSLTNLAGALTPINTILGGTITILKTLSDWVSAPITLTQQMITALSVLGIYLETLWVTWATVIRAFSPTEASLKAAEAWNKAAGLFADLSKFTDFLKQLQDWSKAPIYLTAQMTTGLSTLTMNLQLLWVQLATALHGFVPTDASMEAVQAWNKAAGLFADLSRFVEFLGNLRDWVKEPLTLTSQMTSGLSTLTMNLQLLWVQLATALHGFSPTEASLTAVAAWNKAAGLFTDLTRFTEFLAKLRDWAKEPVYLTAQMDSTLHSLGMSLQLLWVTWATVMHGFAPTEASLAAAEAWGKAAGLFDPLTRIMDFLEKLNDWTKAPIAYSATLQGQFAALLTALKSMTESFVATAQQAGISEAMQKAADALSDMGGKGMDALGKAMQTIKDLFEFKIESGPGWVQQQGGNNIWSTGSSTPGIPAADAVKTKVDGLMAALKAIVDSVKAGVSNIGLGEDASALKTKMDVIAGILSDAASIVKSAQELASSGANTALSIAINVAFTFPDLGAEIAALPIPVVHIPVVFDVPPLPTGTSGSGSGSASTGGGNNGTITTGGGNNGTITTGGSPPVNGGGVTVNVNLSTAAGLTGTLSLLTNMAAG